MCTGTHQIHTYIVRTDTPRCMLPFIQAYDMPCILYYSINTASCNVRIQPQSLAQTERHRHTRNAAPTYILCKTQNEPHETETVSNANCSNVRIVRTFNSFHTNNCFQFPSVKCYGSTTVLHSIKVKFKKPKKPNLLAFFAKFAFRKMYAHQRLSALRSILCTAHSM